MAAYEHVGDVSDHFQGTAHHIRLPEPVGVVDYPADRQYTTAERPH